MTESKRTTVAQKDHLKNGVPTAVRVDEVELVVVRTQENVSVFQGRCPHQGTSLSSAAVENGQLVCSAHGWTFDAVSGARIDAAAPCLERLACAEENGAITVDSGALRELGAKVRAPSRAKPEAPKALRTVGDLPGPGGLPWLGQALSLDMDHLHLQLGGWAEKYGDLFRIQLPQGPMVIVVNPELTRKVLKERPDTYRRIGTFEPLFKEVGAHGVFSQEGATWARQRRLVMPALNTKQLRGFYDQMKLITGRLEKRWARAAENKSKVTIQKEMTLFTVDITTSLAFGYDLNTIEGSGGEVQQHLEAILPIIATRSLAAVPYWRYFKLPKDRRLDRSLVALRKLIDDLLRSARAKLAAEGENAKPSTFLEALLLAKDEDGSQLSEDEIFGNVLTMLLAGEDTTAHSMAWMVNFMCDLPEIQARMQKEADDVLGASRMPDAAADADRLRYIEAVTFEAMRMKPVAPLFFMEAAADTELGGVKLPKGTTMVLHLSDRQLRDEYFQAAKTFDPERWLRHDDAAPGHDVGVYMPFGYGPRHCPGKSLAMLEIKVVMAMLCKNFGVKKTPAHPPVDEIFGFTMHPTDIDVVFEKR